MRNILHSQDEEAAPQPGVLAHVAGNVRRLRQNRGMSQALMGQLSGLSRRMIVAIENSQANISLSSLDRLAGALGATLSELVRPPNAEDSRRIDSLAWRGASPDSRAILLGAAPATRETELWIWSLGEGERYSSEADSENWHEMLLVIEGSLRVESADSSHLVATGDFLIFSSARPYVFANAGQGIVRFVRNVVL